ncbi:phasin family protein [Pararoseomonas indoligenes]|uniref:Phasin family protein n=1 Tax=Roseomonas indoligenes TaxID=2820811 RepID=A0A940MZI0_9PROT|nr:phasin family protein [Pararoseomonas indoligenes]MBP0493734.1 phasin family protein [Pararoseomonas indoligenes]
MSDRPTLPPEMDPMRLLSEMRLPMMDVQALADAQRRNLEALSVANRVALEGAQAVARRHMEILQQSMAEMTDAVRGATSVSNPQDQAAKQAAMVKSSYEKAVTNMKELADLIQKSNSEALTVLNKRFSEAMDEVRGLVAKKEG